MSFAAALTNGNDALFSGLPNGTHLVKESNNLLSGITTDQIGRLSYQENVPNGVELRSEQDEAIPALIAKAGDQAPGLAVGVNFFQFFGHVNNRYRQVGFAAELDGAGISTANDVSLWIHDPFFGTEPIAQEGSTIQINVADTRTLTSITPSFNTISLQDGGQKSFNERGELAYLANFTDGNTALLIGRRQSSDPVFEDGFD